MVLVDISSLPQNLFPNKEQISFKYVFYVFINISLPHEPQKHSILGNTYYCGLTVAHSKPHQILYRSCNAQAGSAGAWCSFPTYILLVLATLSSSLGWRLILACYSCIEGPVVFIKNKQKKKKGCHCENRSLYKVGCPP